jgi:hypothetical protein
MLSIVQSDSGDAAPRKKNGSGVDFASSFGNWINPKFGFMDP